MTVKALGTNSGGMPIGVTGIGNPVHAEPDTLGNPIIDPKTGSPLWFPDTLPYNAGSFDLTGSSSSFTSLVNTTVEWHMASSDMGTDPTFDMLSQVAIAFFRQGSQDLQRNQPYNSGKVADPDLVNAANYHYGYTLSALGIPANVINAVGRAAVEPFGGTYEGQEVQAGIDDFNYSHGNSNDNGSFDGAGLTFDDPSFGGPPPPPNHVEPLVLDLKGTGALTISVKGTVNFDFNNDGWTERLRRRGSG